MKAHLMFRDRDFDLKRPLPANERALAQDLELGTLWGAMAGKDEFLLDVVTKATLQSLADPQELLYRQAVLRDCMENPELIREIYGVAVESIDGERKEYWGIFRDQPEAILHRSVAVMQLFARTLGHLKKLADMHADKFRSEGFTAFFAMIREELNDEYFGLMQQRLKELEFKGGLLESASLGEGNAGVRTALRRPNAPQGSWLERLFAKRPAAFSFSVDPRDESGIRALNDLSNRGLNFAADALAQSADHVLGFFRMVRAETGFYIGCLNLREKLKALGEPAAFPEPLPLGERRLAFRELYDICLSLTKGEKVVGNDLDTRGKDLVIITGANQGGKSTFLWSMGLSLLMMQCGMFVPAQSFSANTCSALFTHYKREEDASMNSGKLDEELGRMSEIVDEISPDAAILFNESFAATNEREGSEIARQVVDALLEKHIQVFFVTHFYEFAHGYYRRHMPGAVFLRAQREPDGSRTFRLTEGEPLRTSFGEDLYRKIFRPKEAE